MANQITQSGQTGTALSNTQFTRKVSSILSQILEKKQKALPKSLNKERFELNTVQMMQDAMKDYKSAERWKQCDPTSVAMTLSKAAFLDLDFFNGECYAIPYGNSVQFQTDYKGEIKLIKKYSSNPIRDVYAKLVRQGDVFKVSVEDGVQHLVYEPDPFSDNEIIGAFAVIYYKDGSMIYDTMSKKEIDGIRNSYSKSGNSKAWVNSYGEMCKKTVLRRICKLVDLDFNADQIRAFNDGGDADFRTEKATVVEHTEKKDDIFANDPAMQKRIEAKMKSQAEPVPQAPAEDVAISQEEADEFAAFEAAYDQVEPPQEDVSSTDQIVDESGLPFK